MKRLITFLFIIVSFFCYSQNVGINSLGTAPDASSRLDVSATDKGILIPRVNIADLTTAAPVTIPTVSLLVYNTNVTSGVGFYFWDGTKWTKLSDGNSNSDNDWYEVGGTSSPDNINDDIFTFNKVGIGLNNPSRLLTVASGLTDTGIRLESTDDGSLLEFSDGGGNLAKIGLGGAGNQVGDLIFDAGINGTDMVVDAGGNIGMGVNAPTEKLEVRGSILSNAAAGIVKVGETDNPNVWWMVADGNYFSIRKNNIAPYPFVIADNENVGIGTAIPSEKLDILGSLKMVDGNQGVGKILTSDINGVGSWQQPSASVITGSINIGSINIPTPTTSFYQGSSITLTPGTWIIRPYGFFRVSAGSSAVQWYLSSSSTVFTPVAGSGIASAPISQALSLCYNNAEFKSVTVGATTTYYLWGRIQGGTGSMVMNANEGNLTAWKIN